MENNCRLCEERLDRADKLIGGLADEKVRWSETVDKLTGVIKNVVGDVLISAGFVAYLGAFTVSIYLDLELTFTFSRAFYCET